MPNPLSDASVAHDSEPAPQVAPPVDAAIVPTPASVASTAESLATALDFSMTVGQARQRFVALRRHVPAERTMQNYCVQGDIAARKIRTTYGAEWIINQASLDAFVLRLPELPSAASDAELTPQASHAAEPSSDIAAAHSRTGDASDAARVDDMRPIGESRHLVDVLIENARLLAQVEDRTEAVADLKRERSFMQDQVRSAVKLSERALTQGDNLLRTLQVMRLGPGIVLNDAQAEAGQRPPVDNSAVPHATSGL